MKETHILGEFYVHDDVCGPLPPRHFEHFLGSPQAASVAEIIAGEVLWITQL